LSLNQLHKQLKEKNIKVLFSDYFDTIVHRTVHPNYTQRLWAKFMVRELGLPIAIDKLYFIRQASIHYLRENLSLPYLETPYDNLKAEICKRLINIEAITLSNKYDFLNLFEDADVRAESSVQYLNQEILDTLKYFKSNGGRLYLVSDFYGSKSLFEKLLKHHGIIDLFDGIYSSAELEKSKHTGTIYSEIINELSIRPEDVMMIGDNFESDYNNAIKNGLNAYHIPHKKYLKKNKRNNFGNDQKQINKVVNSIYKTCNKNTSIPYTEYIVFYHVFVERLYKAANRNNIKDLFFLSREGKFLKKLFDSYQEFVNIDESKKIKTHYLKISRQASMQIALKDIELEDFSYLKKFFFNLSINDFLSAVNCSDLLREEIISQLNADGENVIEEFFSSSEFEKIKANETFKTYYNSHRKVNRNAFEAYINSFNVDIENNGITLVDIGWGGTMQEAISKFYNHNIPVTAYYLGLGKIYDIQSYTKRYGLNFSLLPFADYNDRILLANLQLYEQFSAADHGSAVGYSLEQENYALEYYKPEEKWLYETYINAHQDEMFKLHKLLLKTLDPICYNREMMQAVISKLALKVGLLQTTRKVKFLDTLNYGFYQNVGDNRVGLSYNLPRIKNPIHSFIWFLITPEKYFRYFVKLKLVLYQKNKVLGFFAPMYFIYLYFDFNKYLRFKIINRFFLLKYNVFK